LVKIGIIGVGLWGSTHLRKLVNFREEGIIQISGIYDINKDRLKSISKEYLVPAKEINELLKESDGIIIATPPSTHYEVATKVINEGVTVLIEKPMTNNPRKAEEICKLAEKMKVEVLVGYILRFNPAVRKLRELISRGGIGSITSLSARRVGPRGKRHRDVGVILDLATHEIDVARYILSRDPTEVYSMYGSICGDYEDYAIILLRYGDILHTIQTNLLTPHKIRTLDITGTEGYISMNYISQDIIMYKENQQLKIKVDKEEPLINELKHFINVIKGKEKPLCTCYDALITLKTAYQALEYPNKNIKLNF